MQRNIRSPPPKELAPSPGHGRASPRVRAPCSCARSPSCAQRACARRGSLPPRRRRFPRRLFGRIPGPLSLLTLPWRFLRAWVTRVSCRRSTQPHADSCLVTQVRTRTTALGRADRSAGAPSRRRQPEACPCDRARGTGCVGPCPATAVPLPRARMACHRVSAACFASRDGRARCRRPGPQPPHLHDVPVPIRCARAAGAPCPCVSRGHSLSPFSRGPMESRKARTPAAR